MIPERNAREAITSARQGQNVSQIARGLGHDRKTIRIYLNGSRAPGKTRSHPGTFVPFAGYAAQRIAGDPHLRTAGLHGELAALGYRGSYSALTRELRSSGLGGQCPACRGRPQLTWRPAARLWNMAPDPQPLPVRLRPVAGETMASYLARLAAANHVPVAVILACLPKWFTERAGAHDDLAGLAGSSPYGIACLAALTGISATALGRALPAFAARPYPGRPVIRAAAACRRCCAQRGAAGPIPVHLPACQRICERHQIWLGASRQINVAAVPQIARACRRAAQLCDRYGTIQYLFAETTARQQTAGSQDRARNGHTARAILTLAAANPGTPHDHPDLLGAAGYPPVAATAASILRQQPITPRGPDSLAKPAAGMAPGQVHWQSGGRPSAT